MAELTILPERQQANTQILGEDNRVLDNYWKGAEMKYRQKLFEYKKKKDEIDDRVKALDFNTAGTWNRDMPLVTKELEGYIKHVAANPTSITPTVDNMGEYLDQLQKGKNIEFLATKSKADKAQYDLWKQKIATDTDLKNHAADYLKQLDQWAEMPLTERGDFSLVPQLDYNLQLMQDAISKDLPASKDIAGKVQYIGGEKKFPTVTKNDMVEATKRAEGFWANNSHGTQDHFNDLYNDPNNPAQIDKTVFPSAHDYAIAQLLPPEIKAKDFELRSIDKTGSGKPTQEEIQKRKELIYKIQNKEEGALDILRGLKYGGVPPKSVKYTTVQTDAQKLARERDELYKKRDSAETPKKDKADLQKQIDDLTDKISKTKDTQPTVIQIQTQPTAEGGEGKVINLEVSEKTGGGFLSINQLLNDLEGQNKISVEDLDKIPDVKVTEKKETNDDPLGLFK